MLELRVQIPPVARIMANRTHKYGPFDGARLHTMATLDAPSFRDIQPPEWLQGEGLKEWARITLLLKESNLLSAVDANLLAIYCRTFARWLEIEKAIEQEGLTIANANSPTLIRANPLIKMQQAMSKELMQFARHFGFSPHSRQNITLPGVNKTDEQHKNAIDEFNDS